jgi:hypothetical protein
MRPMPRGNEALVSASTNTDRLVVYSFAIILSHRLPELSPETTAICHAS